MSNSAPSSNPNGRLGGPLACAPFLRPVLGPGRRRRGVILVMSLWVVGLLGLLAWNLASRARISIALADYRGLALEAELLGRSGMARSLWLIRNDPRQVDHLGEAWAFPQELDLEIAAPSSKQDEAEVGLVLRDELAKININLIGRDTLREILDRTYGFDIEADDVAEAIMDWIDADDSGNYETSAYETSLGTVGPRNGPLVSIEELMDIQGVTAWLFFGEDANGNGALEPEEDDGELSLPVDNKDAILQPGLRDIFTIEGDGRINVNTIPGGLLAPVLASVLGSEESGAFIQAIDARRYGRDAISGSEDDSPFADRQDIAAVFGAESWRKIEASDFDFDVATSLFTVGVYVRLAEDGVVYSGRGLIERADDGGVTLLSWISD